eukprot:COSAG02_NODE_825_length_16730_cov_58.738260_17_plen_50_part_00
MGAAGVNVGSSPSAFVGNAAAFGLRTWHAVCFDVHCNDSTMSSTLNEHK